MKKVLLGLAVLATVSSDVSALLYSNNGVYNNRVTPQVPLSPESVVVASQAAKIATIKAVATNKIASYKHRTAAAKALQLSKQHRAKANQHANAAVAAVNPVIFS